jgi:FkbM family methyltransferase
VDVGCFEPIQFSNTFIFYQRGWHGLAIDANPTLEGKWAKTRPRDRFVNSGVAEASAELEYFRYEKFPACNGFGVKARPNLKANVTKVRCEPLAKLLDENLPPGTQIDLMSIDCEGMDLQALRSNDFKRFRPRVLLVEDDDKSAGSEIQHFCEGLGYNLYALCHRSKIFVSDRKD